MGDPIIGGLGIAALLALIFLRVPVALAMAAVGFVGISWLADASQALALLGSESFAIASKFELLVIPLFILMGNIASRSGLSRSLYDAAFALVGHRRGGLAMATLMGCGAFSALCGSSIAAALTMGKVSLAQMERFGYAPRLATATVAAGGTLGILIPPSTGLVIYALLTEQSIGRLFLAAFLPGLVLLALFIAAVAVVTRLAPELGPAAPPRPWRARARALISAAPGLTLILITIGGLYVGIFSPVESAAVGAGLLALWGILAQEMRPRDLWVCAREAAATTTTVMLILIAAHLFNPFLALSHLPDRIGAALTSGGFGPWVTLGLIIGVYLVLGAFMDGFAMLVLTVPIFFPVVTGLGFDPIWFGILVMIVLEMGLLSPPVGMNVFIVHSMAPQVPQAEIYRGIVPFWGAMALCILVLCLAPWLATALPAALMG